MILCDTSGWYAAPLDDDPNHERALVWLENNLHRELLLTDYTLDEALTLFRAREQNEIAIDFGQQVLDGDWVSFHRINKRQWMKAWKMFST